MININNIKKTYIIEDKIKSTDICGLPKEIISIMKEKFSENIINIIIGYYGLYILSNNNFYENYNKIKNKSINISTMALTVNLGDIKIEIEDIYKYIKLDINSICLKKFGTNEKKISNYDTLLDLYGKKKKKKKKKSVNEKIFYNQITLILNVGTNLINIFIFKNGKVKIAGCEKDLDIKKSIYFLFKLLKNKYCYWNNNTIKKIKFVDNIDNIYISDIKINNIVSDFKLNIEIEREILHKELNDEGIRSTFESLKHSGVIIKKKYKSKITTIIVFHTGSIIIMGSKTLEEILDGYNFINEFIKKNYNNIVKSNILSLLEKEI